MGSPRAYASVCVAEVEHCTSHTVEVTPVHALYMRVRGQERLFSAVRFGTVAATRLGGSSPA
jgi:hypothetical protein